MKVQDPPKHSGKLLRERIPYALELFEDDGFGNRVLKSMPTPSELDRFYATNFSRQSYERFGKKLEALRRAWFGRSFLSKSQKLRPAVLEVGSGNGQFLAAFRKLSPNAGLSAVEFVNPDLKKVASQNQIDCFSSLEELEMRGGSFDLIALWHVLEHLADPWSLIRRLTKLLKQEGALVFSTPNMFCPGVLRYPSSWPWNQPPPIHLWHFHPKALERRLHSEFPDCGIHAFTRESRDANFLFDAFVRPQVLSFVPFSATKNLRFQSVVRLTAACLNETILNPILRQKGSFGSEIVAILKR